MKRKNFSPRDLKRRRAEVADPLPLHVNDHAIVRYLERVLEVDISALKLEIGLACARSQGAPCVKVMGARFLVRDGTVVSTLGERQVPRFNVLAGLSKREEAEEA